MTSQEILYSYFEEGEHTLGHESGSYDYFCMNNSNKFSPRDKIPNFECFNYKEKIAAVKPKEKPRNYKKANTIEDLEMLNSHSERNIALENCLVAQRQVNNKNSHPKQFYYSQTHIDISSLGIESLVTIPLKDSVHSLIDLNLSQNNIYQFPQELFQLKRIKVLRLDFNYLKYIPTQIGHLKTLEHLSLLSNKLLDLPEALFTLQGLKSLNIGKNNLTSIDQNLSKLSTLTHLFLQGNPLTELPTNLFKLIYLQEFGLEWFKYLMPPADFVVRRTDPREDTLLTKTLNLFKSLYEKEEIIKLGFCEFLRIVSNYNLCKVDMRKRNILHRAAVDDEPGVVKAISHAFPSLINQLDQEGHTPLTLSLYESTSRVTEILLLHPDCDPKVGGGQLGSALHIAGSKLDHVLFEKLIKKGCNPNVPDFEKNTVLHLVFSIFSRKSSNSRKICELLMDVGAGANNKNNDKWTPLHLAVRRGQSEAISWAIEFNKKLGRSLKDRGFDFDKKGGENNWTPLHLASHIGNLDMIELLGNEGEVDMFRENGQNQDAMSVVSPSTLSIKFLRKYQLKWVEKNVVNKKTPGSETQGRNVSTMKEEIERKTNDKFNASQKSAALGPNTSLRERATFKNPKSHEIKVNEDKFLWNGDSSSESEDYQVDIEESEEEHEFEKKTLFSRCITSPTACALPPMHDRFLKKKKSPNISAKGKQDESKSAANGYLNDDILKSLGSLNLKNYETTINEFLRLVKDPREILGDRLYYLWLLELIHFKLILKYESFVSVNLPLHPFLLSNYFQPLKDANEPYKNRGTKERQQQYGSVIPKWIMSEFRELLKESGRVQEPSCSYLSRVSSKAPVSKGRVELAQDLFLKLAIIKGISNLACECSRDDVCDYFRRVCAHSGQGESIIKYESFQMAIIFENLSRSLIQESIRGDTGSSAFGCFRTKRGPEILRSSTNYRKGSEKLSNRDFTRNLIILEKGPCVIPKDFDGALDLLKSTDSINLKFERQKSLGFTSELIPGEEGVIHIMSKYANSDRVKNLEKTNPFKEKEIPSSNSPPFKLKSKRSDLISFSEDSIYERDYTSFENLSEEEQEFKFSNVRDLMEKVSNGATTEPMGAFRRTYTSVKKNMIDLK